jgi:hypothetical protein
MEHHKLPFQIVHLHQARPISLEKVFRASGVFFPADPQVLSECRQPAAFRNRRKTLFGSWMQF